MVVPSRGGSRVAAREHSGGCYAFLVVSPSALGFGTALARLADEIVPAVSNIMFVLVVLSFRLASKTL
jgi:hypothetical protein